jgi:hypothetical protein
MNSIDFVAQQHWHSLHAIQCHRQAILDRRGNLPIELDPTQILDEMREDRDAQYIALPISPIRKKINP